MRKSLYIAFSAVVLLLASAASYAIAGTSKPITRTVTVASVATIHGCVNNKTRAIYDESKCPKGYSAVTWNTKGVAGSAGRNGSNGTNGSNGVNGANGTAATISVGSISTGAAGSNASVTNVGSTSAAKLNFSIPQGATGPAGAQGSTGAAGAAGAAGTSPLAAVPLQGTSINSGADMTISKAPNGIVSVCPYAASTQAAVGTTATTVELGGSLYEYVGASCITPGAQGGQTSVTLSDTPTSTASDWTDLASGGQNGTADAWAFVDPGVCAAGGGCTSPVISHGGVAGSGVSFTYNNVGQYELTITGCPAADTPAAGQPFPAAITVTPEGAYPGESSHDSSVIAVSASIRDTTSLGVFSGLGVVHAFMYLGTPDTSTIGQTDSVDEPFALVLNC